MRDFVRPSVCPSVRPSVRWSIMVIELESVKTRISAPAHPSATGIGRVSGLVDAYNRLHLTVQMSTPQQNFSGPGFGVFLTSLRLSIYYFWDLNVAKDRYS